MIISISKAFCGVVILLYIISTSIALGETQVFDNIEKQTGFQKVEGASFILDLKYRTSDNFLKRDVYSAFDLNACYVHPELYKRLQDVATILNNQKQKLVLFDCFRPLSVQKAMWKIVPDSRYVANPKNGSLHNRGIAVDVGIATEDGIYLEFPTAFDSFEPKAWRSYKCPEEDKEKCANRDFLRELMHKVGLVSINSEWWHFQLPEAKKYPLKDLSQ